jgi:hypothetical protein
MRLKIQMQRFFAQFTLTEMQMQRSLAALRVTANGLRITVVVGEFDVAAASCRHVAR